MTLQNHGRSSRLLALAVLSSVVVFLCAAECHAQQAKTPAASAQNQQSLAEGRQFFESRCAACHGLDGRGAERAPDIVTRPAAQQRSDADLALLVKTGFPAAGMPAFSTLDPVTLNALVAYIRLLQGRGSAPRKISGNPQRGEAIFFAKGRCSECHLVAGKGGFIASDLSVFGKSRSVAEIRDSIVKPDAKNTRTRAIRVTTRDATTFTGLARNEDNFSLQLQALDGSFHLLMKSEIETVERQPGSLMPANYGSLLTKQELDDLIAFLVRAAERDNSPEKKNSHEDEEE